jgi:hypothetical protein
VTDQPPASYSEAWPPEQPAPEAPDRRRIVVVTVAVVVALALVAGGALLTYLDRSDGGVVDPEREAPPATLADVEIYQDLSTEHVTGEVDYPQSPPVGGEHDQAWHECGVYDAPVREENMVHSLEHGTVWVTYKPGLFPNEIQEMVQQLPDDSIVSPYPDQDAPVVVTVWGAQLELEGPGDPRLALFVEEYGDGHTSPEPMVTCNGGLRISDDGSTGSDT